MHVIVCMWRLDDSFGELVPPFNRVGTGVELKCEAWQHKPLPTEQFQ